MKAVPQQLQEGDLMSACELLDGGLLDLSSWDDEEVGSILPDLPKNALENYLAEIDDKLSIDLMNQPVLSAPLSLTRSLSMEPTDGEMGVDLEMIDSPVVAATPVVATTAATFGPLPVTGEPREEFRTAFGTAKATVVKPDPVKPKLVAPPKLAQQGLPSKPLSVGKQPGKVVYKERAKLRSVTVILEGGAEVVKAGHIDVTVRGGSQADPLTWKVVQTFALVKPPVSHRASASTKPLWTIPDSSASQLADKTFNVLKCYTHGATTAWLVMLKANRLKHVGFYALTFRCGSQIVSTTTFEVKSKLNPKHLSAAKNKQLPSREDANVEALGRLLSSFKSNDVFWRTGPTCDPQDPLDFDSPVPNFDQDLVTDTTLALPPNTMASNKRNLAAILAGDENSGARRSVRLKTERDDTVTLQMSRQAFDSCMQLLSEGSCSSRANIQRAQSILANAKLV
ncbi:unnamed protein product [Durusdinium trenchii]|uniref:Uncharacterized protein n=1 Tax=Durusdinium trenchii TaxID=1381693 RepID=A0ABP0JVA7_9DINO